MSDTGRTSGPSETMEPTSRGVAHLPDSSEGEQLMQSGGMTTGWEEPAELEPEEIHEDWCGACGCALIDDSLSLPVSCSERLGFDVEQSTFAELQSALAAEAHPVFKNPHFSTSAGVEPIYLHDVDGDSLVTPGLLHWLYGPSGCGKSFVAMTACLDHAGIYISLESGERESLRRLRAMGYHPFAASRFAFPRSADELDEVIAAILCMEPTVVTIDAYGELSALVGTDTNADADVASNIHRFIRPLTEAGHAVVVIDHIAKNTTNTDFPLGSQHKRAQSDVLFHLSVDAAKGLALLRVPKDRYETLAGRVSGPSHEYGFVELTHGPSRARIHPSRPASASALAVSMLGAIKDRIIKALSVGRLTATELDAEVRGKERLKKLAIQQLVDQSYVVCYPGETATGHRCKYYEQTDKPWHSVERICA